MNPQINSAMTEAIKLLGIHSTWIIGIAFIASHFIHNTFLKRNLWRITMVCLTLLVFFTFTGLHQWDSTGIFRPLVSEKLQPPIQSFDSATWNPMKIVNTPDPLLIETTFPQRTDPENQSNAAMNQHRYQALIIWGYLVGASLVGLLMGLNTLWWRKKVFFKSIKVSNPIQNLFNETASKLHFKQSPALLVNEQIKSPLVMGIIRPVMAFPATFTDLFSPKEQSLIMSHEIAHIREKDAQWQCFSNVISVLLWWNPLVWMARWKLRESAEETADAISTCEPADRNQLAECLIRLGREMTSPQWSSSLSIFGAGFKSQLGKRVDRLVNGKAEWNHAPSGLKPRVMHLMITFTVAALLVNLSSWLGLSKELSAGNAFKTSIIGITLMAQENKETAPAEGNQSKPISFPKLKQPVSVKSDVGDKETRPAYNKEEFTHNKTLEMLETTVLPGFTIRRNDIWDNLSRLREAILAVNSHFKELTFDVRGSLLRVNTKPQVSNNSENATGRLRMDFERPAETQSKMDSPKKILPPLDNTNSFGLINVSVHTVIVEILKTIEGPSNLVISEDSIKIELPPLESQRLLYPKTKTDATLDKIASNKSSLEIEKNAPKLYTRTYKINSKTFLPRVQAIVGAMKGTSSKKGSIDTEANIQKLINQFGSNLGIEDLEPSENQNSKAFFYKPRTGVLYVRATLEDLKLLEAAIAALQDRGETTTQIALDMQIVQLDVNGISIFKDMGFEYPVDNKENQFKQIVDAETFERLYLRMQMDSGVEILQSPSMTTLAGRQSRISAKEERTVVISHKDGKIQTEKVKTGPSLSFSTNILPNGELELMAIFELLAFLGYDDPGPIIKTVRQNTPISEDQYFENQNGKVKTDGETSENTQPPFPRFKRLQLDSTARLKSGQTLIMGGLTTSETIKHKSKIPVLGDVPLMGRLFRKEGTDTIENYVCVFITPRIIDELGYPAASN
jgi:beta-lactamase regulating signal transducer with metallopeptidase domain/Flp pilus assembly secretin CpaC